MAIHLRQKNAPKQFKKLLSQQHLPQHVPSYLAKSLYELLVKSPKSSEGLNLWLLDNELREFMDICGGCERIKNTLVSISFRVIVKHVMMVFIIILPCSLVDSLGIWTLPATILISYLIISIEGIARNLEEPFGLTEDHLNLEALTSVIETSTNQILLGYEKRES